MDTLFQTGFQMAEVLNDYVSSVFITEDISSRSVLVTKFDGDRSGHIGQLFATPEMKNSKPPGLDGTPPKLRTL